jgi:DNA polymerase III epsilon subunit family exonuclease
VNHAFPFSPQQKRAIEAPLGPVLVVAGPGAGKTACLIGRVRYLVEKLGMVPERICAVTFTNKAAEEIAVRLRDSLGRKADDVKRGTIHALCAEVLREHPQHVGLRPGFGIADDDYQRTVLRRLGQHQRAGKLLEAFGRRRLSGRVLTPGDEQLFGEYVAALRKRNVVDFDDLVVLARRLFDERPDVAAQVAARWTYLLVDEFQDVNDAQYDVLRRLAEPHGNLFAVGDDEQSIFSWTGANPDILKRFQRDHAIVQPYVLEDNHRCSSQIFEVARRLLDANPSLFDKSELKARVLSPFPVRAAAFGDDDEEADWILADIAADREAHGLDWGDYAVLYRKHDTGERFESRFIKAGVPCRLAKGRPLAEDQIIGYVIAALRLLRDLADGAAAEAFARKVLPPHLMQRVEAEVTEGGEPFLQALRDLAAQLGRDPDAKKLWRLVYQVENLAAMRGRHQALWGLVQELLSQRVGPYKNALEERHDELHDPLEDPAAVRLAERLAGAQRDKARVVLERAGGLEIGLRGMLFGAGFRLVRYADEVEQNELDDVRLGGGDAGPRGLALTVFKALQILHARGIEGTLRRYVTFDLETTDLDTASCEIVELAAVRVEDGRPVAEFHRLVKPDRPVSAGSARVHGYGDEELRAAPSFAAVWPELREFLGGATIVAHNGLQFDLPVLRRMARPLGGADKLAVFDTLLLARALSGDSARLSDLAARFGVPGGREHHALDDARTLVGVYEALEKVRVVRARKIALVNLLPYLGLALVLDPARASDEETELLLGVARVHALGRFSDALEFYEAERRRTAMHSPSLEEVVQRLGGRAMMDRLRETVDASRRYPAAVARLEALIEQGDDEPLDAAVERFLTRVALSASQGADVDPHRVNLLTLHSTKGLEFSRVYVAGVEDEQLPGWIRADEDKVGATQEARRLLYVGMTRACRRLVLTRAEQRRGKPSGGSLFLEEMGLEIERPLKPALNP